MNLRSAGLLLSACAIGVAGGAEEWPAFPVEWRAGGQSPADVSFLHDAQAGKDGFVRVRDGHLVRPDGRRLRIWGINVTGQAGLPAENAAPAIAARLAALGINCVRFHFLDRTGTLIAGGRDDTRQLDPQGLARLDRFVAELKQRGIYSDLNLNVYRTYKAGDGVREFEALGTGKGATYFDERLLELQREYARALLTHINACTGKAYCDEPAVAVIEFVNENSLVEAWHDNRLNGTQTKPASGTWHDIPPTYPAALTEKFNAWLATRFPAETLARWRREAGSAAEAPLPRLRPADFAKAAPDRFQAEEAFYMEIENNYFRDLAKFLREQLGVKSLLIGNSDHGHSHSGYPLVASLAQLDIVDGHIYWQHPNYTTDPQTGKRTGFSIPNTPMVDDPPHSTPVQLSRTAVAGKPYTVSEANHPFPSEYACEGVPILAAYAALQDWDGIFWYTLGHQDVSAMDNAKLEHFDFAKDPVKLSQLAAGALIFLRGDVQAARRAATRSYSREQVLESLRLPRAQFPYYTPGFPLTLPLIHGVRVASFDGPPTGPFEPETAADLAADTGELAWRGTGKGSGLVVVDTPRSQALIGYVGSSATKNLRAEMQTRFCALTLGALDDQPLAASSRLLLTACARVANTGMEWNDKRTTLAKWGTAPARIEPVNGTVTLTGLGAARGITAQPLDGAGQPLGQAVPLTQVAEGWALKLGEVPTTWFVLAVKR